MQRRQKWVVVVFNVENKELVCLSLNDLLKKSIWDEKCHQVMMLAVI